jgi:hypothetical protein
MPAARWSDAEVRQLRRLATRISVDELTRKLGRSRGAGTAKAFELRLSVKYSENPPERVELGRRRLGGSLP